MSNLFAAIGMLFLFITWCFCSAVVLAFPVMWLWNYAAVDTLHLPTIDLWHALCLSLLSGLLFKSSSTVTKKE